MGVSLWIFQVAGTGVVEARGPAHAQLPKGERKQPSHLLVEALHHLQRIFHFKVQYD